VDTKNILVVDDDQVTCRAIVDILQKIYTVDCAVNGVKGLFQFKEKDYDVVITDYHMPQLNGDIMCMIMKNKKPNLNIIIMSATIEAICCSAKFVRKPVDINKLIKLIES